MQLHTEQLFTDLFQKQLKNCVILRQEILLFKTALRRSVVEAAEKLDNLERGDAVFYRQLFTDLLKKQLRNKRS